MPKIITRTREQVYELWIAALLSGQYLQARQALREALYEDGEEVGTGFCCVGVLCDLANKDRREPWERDAFTFRMPGVALYEQDAIQMEFYEMAPPMREFMGLKEAEVSQLYKMNDDDNMSFEEIAAHIRTKLMPRALKRPIIFKG